MAKRYLWFVLSVVVLVLKMATTASAANMVGVEYSSGYKVYGVSAAGSMSYETVGNYPALSPDGAQMAYSVPPYDYLYINGSQVGIVQGGMWAWSPDGSKLAYNAAGHLYIVESDGTGAHQLGSDGSASHPSWSPDGTKIVYSNYVSGKGTLRIIDSSGNSSTSATSLLAHPSDSYIDDSPSWGISGIAYDSDRTGHMEIYSVNSDGSGDRQLTDTPSYAINVLPQFVAGGGVIYYLGHETNGGNDTYLYRIGAAGGKGKKISTDVLYWISAQQPTLPVLPSSGIHYVALGDSVAAGEGINYGWTWTAPTYGGGSSNYGSWSGGLTSPVWHSDPYSLSGQGCHQSLDGYPSLLRQDLGILNANFYDFACTGAAAMYGVLRDQSSDLNSPQLGGSAQADGVNSDYDTATPDLVTLTVGADDVNFSSFLDGCYGLSAVVCDNSSADVALAGYLLNQKTDLAAVLNEIRNRGIADGHIPLVVLTTYYDPYPVAYDALCPEITLSNSLASPPAISYER